MKKSVFILLAALLSWGQATAGTTPPAGATGSTPPSSAAEPTPMLRPTHSVMLQGFGPELAGILYQYNLASRFALHAGIGLLGDGHLGGSVYLTQQRKSGFSLYISNQFYTAKEVDYGLMFEGNATTGDRQFGLYAPLGLEYLSRKGFTAQLEGGPAFSRGDFDQFNTQPFMFSLRLGYSLMKKGQ